MAISRKSNSPAGDPRATLAMNDQQWRVIGRSVRGAAHIRSGQVNQDAIGWLPKSGEGLPMILVLGDGHGSDKCFRSHEGSRLAIEVACNALQKFGENHDQTPNLSVVKDTAIQWLPQEISKHWREAVQSHLTKTPITEAELKILEQGEGATSVQTVANNQWLAYGTTLLAVLITRSYTLFLQLGDGDILTVAADGTVFCPLPTDDRLLANETTSLSSENAWRDFRSVFRVTAGTPPALIIASTDGCSNSFRSTEDFFKLGTDLWAKICKDGLKSLEVELDPWLTNLSRNGSGDDISLGVLCRTAAIDREGPAFLTAQARQAAVAARAAAKAAATQEPKPSPAPQSPPKSKSVDTHSIGPTKNVQKGGLLGDWQVQVGVIFILTIVAFVGFEMFRRGILKRPASLVEDKVVETKEVDHQISGDQQKQHSFADNKAIEKNSTNQTDAQIFGIQPKSPVTESPIIRSKTQVGQNKDAHPERSSIDDGSQKLIKPQQPKLADTATKAGLWQHDVDQLLSKARDFEATSPDKAIIFYSDAIKLLSSNKLDPKLVDAYLARGNLYFKQEQHFKALNLKRQQLFLAIHDFDNVITHESSNFDALYNLAEVYFCLATLETKSQNQNRTQVANPNYGDAIKNYSKAMRFDALKSESKLPDLYFKRGLTYSALNDYRKAIADFDEVIKFNGAYKSPEYDSAYYQRGDCKFRLGNVQGAVEDFTMAIALDSQNAVLYERRAQAYERLEQNRLAKYDKKQAQEIKSRNRNQSGK